MAVIDYRLQKAENELQAVVQANFDIDTTKGVLTIDVRRNTNI
jgi:hypothetical protein